MGVADHVWHHINDTVEPLDEQGSFIYYGTKRTSGASGSGAAGVPVALITEYDCLAGDEDECGEEDDEQDNDFETIACLLLHKKSQERHIH